MSERGVWSGVREGGGLKEGGSEGWKKGGREGVRKDRREVERKEVSKGVPGRMEGGMTC